MKVKTLIEILEKIKDKNKSIYLWNDEGDRLPIAEIDELDDCVDIMTMK